MIAFQVQRLRMLTRTVAKVDEDIAVAFLKLTRWSHQLYREIVHGLGGKRRASNFSRRLCARRNSRRKSAAIAMWSTRGTRQATAVPPPPEKCQIIEVMNYGGNLICHDCFESKVVGSGNNMMGLSRAQAMNGKICVAGK
jgi:hypothetical protein